MVGVQGVSEEGEVAKRIDVAAQLILRGATVDDLAAIEHAYAPPYAPALDPLAVVAMAAQNQIDGIEAVSPLTDLRSMTVLDVRIPEEREERPLTARQLVAIDAVELRDRAEEVPDGNLLVACAHGTRSAEVVRWLAQRGTRGRYVGGGVSWRVRAEKTQQQ